MVSSLAVAALIVGTPLSAGSSKPKPDVAFMTYSQSGCYGSCIAYNVTLFADGRVIFEAEGDGTPEEIVTDEDVRDAVVAGRHEYRVSREKAEELLAKYRAADLFAMNDSYDSRIADAQSYTIGFSDRGRSKTISDNGGERVGMPPVLNDLMRETNVASKSGAMARGEPDLVSFLEAGGYDFHSLDAAKTLVRAIARHASPATISGLISKGAPLHATWEGKSIAAWAIHAAVTFDDFATIKLLSDRGEIARLSADDRNEIAAFVDLCSIDKARKFKAIGFDPVAAERAGKTFVLKRVGNCSTQDGSDKVADLFRYYLSEGANPNAAIPSGETAIFELWDPEAVDVLIKHGADVNHLNRAGQSAVFSTWDEDVIVRLLGAGTKPVGDYFGTKFWDYAVSKKWTKVIAWLDAHPGVKAIAQGK